MHLVAILYPACYALNRHQSRYVNIESTKFGELLEQLRNYWLFRADSAPCRCLYVHKFPVTTEITGCAILELTPKH